MTPPSPAPEAVPPASETAAAFAGARETGEGEPLRLHRHGVSPLEGLLRVVAAHFGVAAACVVPGDAPAARPVGANVEETLYEALRALAQWPGATDAHEPLVVPDVAEDPAWRAALARASELPFRSMVRKSFVP